MKIKRQKKVHRILNFFKHNFGHRPPYQILMDGTFAQSCLTTKVNIREQLPKYLGDVKLLTTQCCIMELEKLGPQLFGAACILKQFPVHKCGHKEPKPAVKCLKAMLEENNPKRYFIATQDATLREKARKVPGTPVLYLHHSAPTLEKPSNMSEETADKSVSDRMEKSYQSRVLDELKRKEFGDPEEGREKRKRKKGPAGPNPLSCLPSKKKKKEASPRKAGEGPSSEVKPSCDDETDVGSSKKRKRFRKRKNAGTKESTDG